MQDLPYRIVVQLCRFLAFVQRWPVRAEGVENIPELGPAIIASNHVGYFDFVFLAWAARFQRGRFVRFLAKKEVFDSKLTGVFMRAMKHIPVDRTGDPHAALEEAIRALGKQQIVGMFPEGSINQTLTPRKAKTGTVRMAQASGASVIPAAVWGSQRIIRKGAKGLGRHIPITVKYGPPMNFGPDEDPRAATKVLVATINDLLSELQAAYPDKPAGPDDLWWLPTHLGGTAPAPAESSEGAA